MGSGQDPSPTWGTADGPPERLGATPHDQGTTFGVWAPNATAVSVDNALSWLEDYRADGLRFDATAWVRSRDGSLAPDQKLPDGWLCSRPSTTR